jgi:hypothetical protein
MDARPHGVFQIVQYLCGDGPEKMAPEFTAPMGRHHNQIWFPRLRGTDDCRRRISNDAKAMCCERLEFVRQQRIELGIPYLHPFPFARAHRVEQHDFGFELAGESFHIPSRTEAAIGEIDREEDFANIWHGSNSSF